MTGNEVPRGLDLSAGRDESALVRPAGVLEPLRLIARARQGKVEACDRVTDAIEVGYRVFRLDLERLFHLGDRPDDALPGVGVWSLREFAVRLGEVCAGAGAQLGEGRAGGIQVTRGALHGVHQLVSPVRGLGGLGELACDRIDAGGRDGGGGGIRCRGCHGELGLGLIGVTDYGSEGCFGVVRGELRQGRARLGEPGTGRIDAPPHVVEGSRSIHLKRAQARKRLILTGESGLGLLAQGDDLQRPLALLPIGIRGHIVERMLQAKRLGDLSPCCRQCLCVRLGLFRPELGESETNLVVSVAHHVIELHEQSASAPTQGINTRRGGAADATIPPSPEQHNEPSHNRPANDDHQGHGR